MHTSDVGLIRHGATSTYLDHGKALDRLVAMTAKIAQGTVLPYRAWRAIAVRLEVAGLQVLAAYADKLGRQSMYLWRP